jgi:hypothetical protein
VSTAPGWTATVTLNGLDTDEAEIPVPVFVGAAVRVRASPVVLMMIPGNVANPDDVVLTEAPDAIVPAEGVTVIGKFGSATLFPNLSCTCTVTEGVMAVPVYAFDGPWTKASEFAAEAVIVSFWVAGVKVPDDPVMVGFPALVSP